MSAARPSCLPHRKLPRGLGGRPPHVPAVRGPPALLGLGAVAAAAGGGANKQRARPGRSNCALGIGVGPSPAPPRAEAAVRPCAPSLLAPSSLPPGPCGLPRRRGHLSGVPHKASVSGGAARSGRAPRTGRHRGAGQRPGGGGASAAGTAPGRGGAAAARAVPPPPAGHGGAPSSAPGGVEGRGARGHAPTCRGAHETLDTVFIRNQGCIDPHGLTSEQDA